MYEEIHGTYKPTSIFYKSLTTCNLPVGAISWSHKVDTVGHWLQPSKYNCRSSPRATNQLQHHHTSTHRAVSAQVGLMTDSVPLHSTSTAFAWHVSTSTFASASTSTVLSSPLQLTTPSTSSRGQRCHAPWCQISLPLIPSCMCDCLAVPCSSRSRSPFSPSIPSPRPSLHHTKRRPNAHYCAASPGITSRSPGEKNSSEGCFDRQRPLGSALALSKPNTPNNTHQGSRGVYPSQVPLRKSFFFVVKQSLVTVSCRSFQQ